MLATPLVAAQDGGGYLTSGGSAANVTLGQQIATSGIANNRQLHQSEIDWIRGNANDFSQWMCDAHDVCDLSEAQAAGILSGETLSGVSDSFTAYGAGANPIYHAEARDYIAKNYGGATIVDGQTMFGQVEGSREYYNTALNAHTVFSAPELYYLADLQTPGVGAQGSVFTSFLDQVGYDIHTGDFSNTRTDFQAALNTNQHNASLIFNHYGSQAPHDNPAAWVSYARDGLIGMIAADPVNADILNAFSEGGHFNPDTVAVDFGNATFAGMLNETAIGFFENKAENLLIGEMLSITPVVRHPAPNNGLKPVANPTQRQLDRANELGVEAQWVDSEGRIIWPTRETSGFDGGFDGPPTITEIQPGTRFDRYGGRFENGQFVDSGDFVAPIGVPFEQRSLPASSINRPYQEYEVLQPIPNVNSGTAAPWFGQPGGGAQYQLPMSIDDLVQQGFIRPVFD